MSENNKPTQPVRPRDAASLILYRQSSRGYEVLLGRRPGKSSFMPGKYVYPGGAVDPSDGRAQPATPLDPAITPRLAVASSPARARSMAMAAVRETFEETGLHLTQPGDPGRSVDATWSALRELQVAPDLARLRYIGRAITPTIRPKRFHARFFAADGANIEGDLSGNGELIDLQWFSVDATAALDLLAITNHMLTETIKMLESGDPHWMGNCMFTRRNGKHVIKRSADDVSV